MNEEFYRRQSESKLDHEQQKAALQKNSTMETYNLEKQEAHAGHIPKPTGGDVEQPQLSLWQRIRKMIGL